MPIGKCMDLRPACEGRGGVQDVTAVTDNAAVLQQRVTKGTNVFLSTLAEPGEAQFLTVVCACHCSSTWPAL